MSRFTSTLREVLLYHVRNDAVWPDRERELVVELLQEQETPHGHVLTWHSTNDLIILGLIKLYGLDAQL